LLGWVLDQLRLLLLRLQLRLLKAQQMLFHLLLQMLLTQQLQLPIEDLVSNLMQQPHRLQDLLLKVQRMQHKMLHKQLCKLLTPEHKMRKEQGVWPVFFHPQDVGLQVLVLDLVLHSSLKHHRQPLQQDLRCPDLIRLVNHYTLETGEERMLSLKEIFQTISMQHLKKLKDSILEK
jgi:hypothetical protein